MAEIDTTVQAPALTLWVPQRWRPGCYSAADVLDLPQIKTRPMGRTAPRRRDAP